MQYEDALIALLSRENGTMTFLVERVEGKLIRFPGGIYEVCSIVDHTYTDNYAYETYRIDAKSFSWTSWFIFLMGIDGKSCANAPKIISLILDHSPCHNMDLTSGYTLTFDCYLSLYNFFHRIAFRRNAGTDSRDICRGRCVRNSHFSLI